MPPDGWAWEPNLLLWEVEHELRQRDGVGQQRRLPCRRMVGRGSPTCCFGR